LVAAQVHEAADDRRDGDGPSALLAWPNADA